MRLMTMVGVAALVAACAQPVRGQNVKITPLGSHAGELCSRDRALILEDPTGVRILYDAGQSVTGAEDARLGAVHVLLLTHAHGDHIGDQKLKALEAGTCAAPEVVSAAPSSTTGEIVAAKNAAIVMVTPLANFVARKAETLRGKPVAACPVTGNDLVVPFGAPCVAATQTGGTRTVRSANGTRAVEIVNVAAAHDNTVPRELLGEAARKSLEPDSVSLMLGPPSGYVVRFTNGLTVYLSGDTGMLAEMKTVVAEYYKANLMVLNLGITALTVQDAAYVANDLVKPMATIVTHVNEGATAGGTIRAGTRTAGFVAAMKGRAVYPALSGRTMEFNGEGKCVPGC